MMPSRILHENETPLGLYNTLTRRKERFVPIDPRHVRMYVCGPTVYERAHIGNARPVIVFDVLYRLLKQLYTRVTYVRNVTDVDDKINARALEDGCPIEVLTAETTRSFHEDMTALNALSPDIEPRATAHIAVMVAMIERLVERGHAYVAAGHVLFSVASTPIYGALSGCSREAMIAGARVEVAPYKQDPADFVLWKPSPPEMPAWDSPWGRGRPGWHIECSAMSSFYLGETFDIHGGGHDLIFPHHENEIAQSTCAHGRAFVRYWLHNGWLMIAGEKMSKSLDNFITVRQLLDQGIAGEIIRLAILATHYHQPLDWTQEGLRQAKHTIDRFYAALRAVANLPLATTTDETSEITAALCDDLNTPRAIAALHENVTALNKATGRDEKIRLKTALYNGAMVLGLLAQDPEAWFTSGAAIDSGVIEDLIARRALARKAHNFPEADRIREELHGMGVILEDSRSQTTWRKAR
ncbi:Cysteinyl-tRNA synthetase [invertebrate metagenome]|uniref:Cysteine--tRNA ligase n=1 Tax=invertebrate metagenome TaxID=1711999 RepID=A0A484H743_9ZZZZ